MPLDDATGQKLAADLSRLLGRLVEYHRTVGRGSAKARALKRGVVFGALGFLFAEAICYLLLPSRNSPSPLELLCGWLLVIGLTGLTLACGYLAFRAVHRRLEDMRRSLESTVEAVWSQNPGLAEIVKRKERLYLREAVVAILSRLPGADDGAVAEARVESCLDAARTRPRFRIRLYDEDPVIPNLCVVTGERAEIHLPFRRFSVIPVSMSPYFLLYRSRVERVMAPFSKTGHAAYTRLRPLFSRVLDGGLLAVRWVPLVPLELFWLLIFLGDISWVLLIIDRCRGKRDLCRVHFHFPLSRRAMDLRFDMTVISRGFLKAFLELNPTAEVTTRPRPPVGPPPP